MLSSKRYCYFEICVKIEKRPSGTLNCKWFGVYQKVEVIVYLKIFIYRFCFCFFLYKAAEHAWLQQAELGCLIWG